MTQLLPEKRVKIEEVTIYLDHGHKKVNFKALRKNCHGVTTATSNSSVATINVWLYDELNKEKSN